MAVDYNEQAKKILEIAESKGVQSNFFFSTTFSRYLNQISILKQLEEVIKKEKALVNKEYVKGRKNLYTNPAITEYNKTTDSANKTVSTLMKIIREFNRGVNDDTGADEDPLMALINGDYE